MIGGHNRRRTQITLPQWRGASPVCLIGRPLWRPRLEGTVPSLVVALLVVAHGLIHASYLSPVPPAKPGAPAWPFALDRSRLLAPLGPGPATTRRIGVAVLVAVLAGYLVAAGAMIGLLPGSAFVPAIVLGSVASLVMLALFFHPWLVLGIVIDAVLLVAVLAMGWRPGETGL